MLESFPFCPSSWQEVLGHGLDPHSWEERLFAWNTMCLGRDRFFWICGSLDAGVAAGTDVRSDPHPALSFQHFPRAEYLPTGSCHGAWDEILGCFSGQEGSVDPGLGCLLNGEESFGSIQVAGIVLCVLVDTRM